MLDLSIGLCFFMTSSYFQFLESRNIKATRTALESLIIFSTFLFTTGIILACSANSLTKSIKELTGSKPNNCLLWWHIINVFISTVFLALNLGLFWYKTKIAEYHPNTPCEELDQLKDRYRLEAGITAYHQFNVYFDSFLIYLAYRYSSP